MNYETSPLGFYANYILSILMMFLNPLKVSLRVLQFCLTFSQHTVTCIGLSSLFKIRQTQLHISLVGKFFNDSSTFVIMVGIIDYCLSAIHFFGRQEHSCLNFFFKKGMKILYSRGILNFLNYVPWFSSKFLGRSSGIASKTGIFLQHQWLISIQDHFHSQDENWI